MATSLNNYKIVTMGEAMLRFAPADTHKTLVAHEAQSFVRSIAGDELNVAIALARLGRQAQWVSILPAGPMGDVVMEGASNVGVNMSKVSRDTTKDAELGVFTVLPEQQTVHYQRRHSAFAVHSPDSLDWQSVFSPHDVAGTRLWYHCTGITPLISSSCAITWQRAMDAAVAANVPISIDFNHRKQLGTLRQLWDIVSPYLSKIEVLILSKLTMAELCHPNDFPEHAAWLSAAGCQPDTADLDGADWDAIMTILQKGWSVPRLACCFKTRNDSEVQRRYSVIASSIDGAVHSSHPTIHIVKDELGGGSAWAAGLIDCIHAPPETPNHKALDQPMMLQHADVLAALCQETRGDWSCVARRQFDDALSVSMHAPLDLTMAPDSIRLGATSETTSAYAAAASIAEASAHLERAGVVAILRAKNPDVAIARGIELGEMGCQVVEVTLDTTDWLRVLREIAKAVPSTTMVGVGTVMEDTLHLLPEAKAAGARFALSPINPNGFVSACTAAGLACVPSALTSNEIWTAHKQGAAMIKIFPATQINPTLLKTIIGVGPFKTVKFLPSGGIGPSQVQEWIEAGAHAIGLGSNLVGKDIAFPTGTPEFEAARKAWLDKGKGAAQELFDKASKRFR